MSGTESLSLKNRGSLITRHRLQIRRNVKCYFNCYPPAFQTFPFLLLDTQEFQVFGKHYSSLFFFFTEYTFQVNLIKCITYVLFIFFNEQYEHLKIKRFSVNRSYMIVKFPFLITLALVLEKYGARQIINKFNK